MYKDKRVLVTGHTGFKGSWLTLWLRELGADVIGYSFEGESIEGITHIIGDIRDKEKVSSVFKEYNPEIVFHLAAQSLVRPSYQEPHLTFETNLMGTINLFEAAKDVKAFINVTSDKCYENKEQLQGYKETDSMGGHDPYSASKGAVELISASYRKSFDLPIATVRAGNVIGGNDWAIDRLIPDCVRSLVINQPIIIRNPQAERPWQFVLEPLAGYLKLGALVYKDKSYCEGWNFAPENSVKVETVVKEIINCIGVGEYKVISDGPHEANLLRLDTTKAKTKLDWHPVYDFKESIKQTIDWYKAYYEGKDMLDYSIKQIENYEIHSSFRKSLRV